MTNNTLITLGIVGILGTGSAAVVANTDALLTPEPSPLINANEVLLTPEPVVPLEATPTAPETLAPSEEPATVNPSAPSTPTTSPTTPVYKAPVTAPAPVDATSGGSGYYDEDDDDDHDDDDDDDDYEDDDD